MKSTNESEFMSNLSTDEAIILQQIHEDGEDDTNSLAQMLSMSQLSVMSVVEHLKKKGFVYIDGDYDSLWVHLTKRGRRFMNYLWPESFDFAR